MSKEQKQDYQEQKQEQEQEQQEKTSDPDADEEHPTFACPWPRGNSMLDCASLTNTVAIPLELAPVRETLCNAINAMLIGCKHGKNLQARVCVRACNNSFLVCFAFKTRFKHVYCAWWICCQRQINNCKAFARRKTNMYKWCLIMFLQTMAPSNISQTQSTLI